MSTRGCSPGTTVECNCLMCIAEGDNSPHRRRASEVETVGWAILQALHEGVDDGPQSWSDMASDQEARIKKAAIAAIEAVTDLSQYKAQGFSLHGVAQQPSSPAPFKASHNSGEREPSVMPAWGAGDPVAWAERIGGKIVSVRLDQSVHCTKPLYAVPQPSPRLEREGIHQAAKEGNLQFWRDQAAHQATFEAWKNGGYIGDCPQTMKGTLVDYITDAILALLSPDTTVVTSTSRGEGE